MKNILIIHAHPDKESFNFALGDAYKKGALKTKANIEEIALRDLKFNLNLQFGYRKRTELEPDLIASQEKIKKADHIVLIYPVWWGSTPALLKGFFDRILLPGFAYQKRENSLWWDKLLKGKTARVISTLDQPAWYYRLFYFRPSYQAVKRMTFQFIGVQKVRATTIGPIRLSKVKFRENWLRKIEKLGEKQN